ncbi:MAG: hypothetical protein Q9166_003912 [cf. Caloplaca sp. 2 TL-2023]
MPRTLPWLTNQDYFQAKATRAPPAKRVRPLSPDSDSSDNGRSVQRAEARQRRELAQRAGLSHDDIYIMVEDEFLSTAQLFTSHLHHAEYVRLKNAAKARNTSHLKTNATSISRSTDSITAMRAETTKKNEAEVRMRKNKAALEKMKADAVGGIAVTDDEDNVDSDDDADKEPWVGTSLQGLMAPAARKNLTSLSGLQGIQSSTRASKGYTKPDDSQSQGRHTQDNISPFPKPTHLDKQHDSTLRPREISKRPPDPTSTSSDTDDDDLDAPNPHLPPSKPHTIPHPPPPPKPRSYNPLTLAAEDLLHPAPREKKHHPTHNRTSPAPHARLPGPSPPSKDDEVAAARRRLQQRRERAAAAAAGKKKRDDGVSGGNANVNVNVNVNVNEIPVFLV